MDRGWYEVKMTGKLPERRSYHVSGIFKESLFVFGGQDLKEGIYNTCWRLPIKIIMEGGTTCWEEVHTVGTVPPPIAHHCGAIYKDTFYVYGGMIGSDSNNKIYGLNLITLTWQIVQPASQDHVPKARDDHSACQNDNSLYVFGGYVEGSKANDLWKFDLDAKTWTQLEEGEDESKPHKSYSSHQDKVRPCPRIGASLTFFNEALYLLGGHDSSNEKLDDFWKFDLSSNKWIQLNSDGQKPSGRNGHTAIVINQKLIVFGGIIEITKESDEIFVYDFATNTWSIVEASNRMPELSPVHMNRAIEFESQNEKDLSTIKKEQIQPYPAMKKSKNTSSMPNLKQNFDISLNHKQSMFNNTLGATGGNSDATGGDQQRGGSLNRQKPNIVDQQFIKYMRGQQALSSPTSIQMKNAFILKNSNPSFEQYFLAMKKRKNIKLGQSLTISQTYENSQFIPKSIHILRNKPSARDGHSSFVYNNRMFIFGGDRHHMPFNDIFFLDIDI